MKKTATLLLLLAAVGLNAQTSGQAFVRAAGEANTRLEKALDELDVIQEEVNAKRPKLGAQLDDVESTTLRLRDEASNAARIKAGFDVEVSQLEKEKQSVIDTNNYIQSTLLNEYIRRLELTIDPSEIPVYSDSIRASLEFLEAEEKAERLRLETIRQQQEIKLNKQRFLYVERERAEREEQQLLEEE